MCIIITFSRTALSASTNNMTSISSKKVQELGKKYKSENTEELILKGFVVYWLQDDAKGVKIKAEDVEPTVPVPTDTLPDPDNPQPPPVEKVGVEYPVDSTAQKDPITGEDIQKKRQSHFRTMYAPARNATGHKKSSHRHGRKKYFLFLYPLNILRKIKII